jgi:hypothetical protein
MAYDLDTRRGESVDEQARWKSVRVWGLLALIVALVAALVFAAFAEAGFYVSVALMSVLVLVVRSARIGWDDAFSWIGGGCSEHAVGEALETLRAEGFIVMHDIEQADEGKIDHLVSGHSGVFLIETNHSSYLPNRVTAATRQAAKVADDLGVWITPVVCVGRELKRPYQLDRVSIVGRAGIAGWIREQSQPVLASERLARWADRL